MNVRNECIPCVTRQLVSLSEKLTDDYDKQKKIIEHGLKVISNNAFEKTAPELTGLFYAFAKEVTGIEDPFKEEKEVFNNVALKLIEEYELKDKILKSSSPIQTAIRLSVAGNIIDFSLGEEIKEDHVRDSIYLSMSSDLFGDQVDHLINEINKHQDIMIIGDNAGEIIFDQLLTDTLKDKNITYVVKGGPIVNDVTIEDAIAIGLDKTVRIIDTGSSYQGVIMEHASESLKAALKSAPLVISKGQANYECLSDYDHNNLFFLLRGKCQVIADVIGCQKGDFICIKN